MKPFFLALSLILLVQSNALACDSADAPLIKAYLELGDLLAADGGDVLPTKAKALASTIEGVECPHVTKDLRKSIKKLAAAKDLAATREAYKTVSAGLVDWATQVEPQGLQIVHCSMAGASWVQAAGDKRNPYYGSEMLRCGKVTASFDAEPKSEEAGHQCH